MSILTEVIASYNLSSVTDVCVTNMGDVKLFGIAWIDNFGNIKANIVNIITGAIGEPVTIPGAGETVKSISCSGSGDILIVSWIDISVRVVCLTVFDDTLNLNLSSLSASKTLASGDSGYLTMFSWDQSTGIMTSAVGKGVAWVSASGILVVPIWNFNLAVNGGVISSGTPSLLSSSNSIPLVDYLNGEEGISAIQVDNDGYTMIAQRGFLWLLRLTTSTLTVIDEVELQGKNLNKRSLSFVGQGRAVFIRARQGASGYGTGSGTVVDSGDGPVSLTATLVDASDLIQINVESDVNYVVDHPTNIISPWVQTGDTGGPLGAFTGFCRAIAYYEQEDEWVIAEFEINIAAIPSGTISFIGEDNTVLKNIGTIESGALPWARGLDIWGNPMSDGISRGTGNVYETGLLADVQGDISRVEQFPTMSQVYMLSEAGCGTVTDEDSVFDKLDSNPNVENVIHGIEWDVNDLVVIGRGQKTWPINQPMIISRSSQVGNDTNRTMATVTSLGNGTFVSAYTTTEGAILPFDRKIIVRAFTLDTETGAIVSLGNELDVLGGVVPGNFVVGLSSGQGSSSYALLAVSDGSVLTGDRVILYSIQVSGVTSSISGSSIWTSDNTYLGRVLMVPLSNSDILFGCNDNDFKVAKITCGPGAPAIGVKTTLPDISGDSFFGDSLDGLVGVIGWTGTDSGVSGTILRTFNASGGSVTLGSPVSISSPLSYGGQVAMLNGATGIAGHIFDFEGVRRYHYTRFSISGTAISVDDTVVMDTNVIAISNDEAMFVGRISSTEGFVMWGVDEQYLSGGIRYHKFEIIDGEADFTIYPVRLLARGDFPIDVGSNHGMFAVKEKSSVDNLLYVFAYNCYGVPGNDFSTPLSVRLVFNNPGFNGSPNQIVRANDEVGTSFNDITQSFHPDNVEIKEVFKTSII